MELPIGAIIAVVYGLLATIIGAVWRHSQSTREKLADLQVEIARNYPSRADLKEAITEIRHAVADLRGIVEDMKETQFHNRGRGNAEHRS